MTQKSGYRAWLEGWHWRGNIYIGLALSLALVMVLYSLSRVAFYFFNATFFPEMTIGRFLQIMWGGLRFDLAAVLYTNSLFILLLILPFTFRHKNWYHQIIKWIFFITNSIALAVNTADFVYYRFTLRRTTLSVLSQFENETNFSELIFQFLIDYWYAAFFWIALVFLLVWNFKRIRFSGPLLKNGITYHVSAVALMPVVIYLFIGGARGGFKHSTRPITLSNAAEYSKVPKDINLVLNTPFALMRTAKANVIEKVKYFPSDEDAARIFNPVRQPNDTGTFIPQNVVVIILESFSKEFVGSYNGWLANGTYRGYTPFLDSLIGVSQSMLCHR